ncbi:GNAT family N-acetyltransferase [Oceanobacter mangrovi]|uniref:GNAT family N-acetyltransferase n=1 Tax=Oceanobacter mangrovi TaxID=2862510 RepID=UPI001FE61DD7|nr:GNAT family N-acetyltransferase [Oceanobacter mangrovi]
MNINDYDALLQLWQQTDGISIRTADSRAGVSRYLDRNPGLSFVIERDGELLGSLMAGHDGKRGYLQHLAVASAWRGNGFGRLLVQTCLAALQQQAIDKSHVFVFKTNPGGQAFWQHLGWQQRQDLEVYSYTSGTDLNS